MVANGEMGSLLDRIVGGVLRPRAVSGRVVSVEVRPKQFRFRSPRVAWFCHWLGQHVLCAGPDWCGACASGVPRREFSFVICDALGPAGLQRGILRLSAADVAAVAAAFDRAGQEQVVGAVVELSRPTTRRPVVASYVKHCPGLQEIDEHWVVEEVLALHGVRCVTPVEHAPHEELLRILAARVREFLHAS
jgi:hypothetical protein